MIRTQVQLTKDQHEFLKRLSHETGESLSALIRRAVDGLNEETSGSIQGALSLLGAFEADANDVSVHHDRYFPERRRR